MKSSHLHLFLGDKAYRKTHNINFLSFVIFIDIIIFS